MYVTFLLYILVFVDLAVPDLLLPTDTAFRISSLKSNIRKTKLDPGNQICGKNGGKICVAEHCTLTNVRDFSKRINNYREIFCVLQPCNCRDVLLALPKPCAISSEVFNCQLDLITYKYESWLAYPNCYRYSDEDIIHDCDLLFTYSKQVPPAITHSTHSPVPPPKPFFLSQPEVSQAGEPPSTTSTVSQPIPADCCQNITKFLFSLPIDNITRLISDVVKFKNLTVHELHSINKHFKTLDDLLNKTLVSREALLSYYHNVSQSLSSLSRHLQKFSLDKNLETIANSSRIVASNFPALVAAVLNSSADWQNIIFGNNTSTGYGGFFGGLLDGLGKVLTTVFVAVTKPVLTEVFSFIKSYINLTAPFFEWLLDQLVDLLFQLIQILDQHYYIFESLLLAAFFFLRFRDFYASVFVFVFSVVVIGKKPQ